MRSTFSKIQSLGNDYIIYNSPAPNDAANSTKMLCDRRHGIGADGVLFVTKTAAENTIRMDMWNSDGTESPMCGNGARCAGYFAYEKGIVKGNDPFTIISHGHKLLLQRLDREKDLSLKIGPAYTKKDDIPVCLPEGVKDTHEPISLTPYPFKGRILGLGNPHCIILLEDLEALQTLKLEEIGPQIENLHIFPKKTNVAFIAMQSRTKFYQRTWERGCGETQSCGSGAAAAFIAAIDQGLCNEDNVQIVLKGGTILSSFDPATRIVEQKAPVVHVFDGVWRGVFAERSAKSFLEA